MLSLINFGYVEFIYFFLDWLFLLGKYIFIFIIMERNKCEVECRLSVVLLKFNVIIRDKSNNK